MRVSMPARYDCKDGFGPSVLVCSIRLFGVIFHNMKLSSADASLTARQLRFVNEYLLDANATRAAIRAGVASSGAHVWGSRTLRSAKVAQALQARQKADQLRLQIDRDRVVVMLLEAYEMAKEKREPAAMVSACRELAKLFGLYEPMRAQIDISRDDSAMSRLDELTDQQLLQLIQGLDEPAGVFCDVGMERPPEVAVST